MSLTPLAIEKLKPKDKIYRLADAGGLCIEVTPKSKKNTHGTKLWRWRYYFNGKPQMLALGKYPAVGLKEARRRAEAAREQLEAGKHPTREKKAEKLRRAVSGENTFEAITRKWMAVKGEQLNKKYHKQSLVRLEKHVFPLIGDLPISEIKIPDVVRVVETVAERGTVVTAKWVKQAISQVFRYASQRGLCEFNPAADMRDLLPQTEEKHHACIPPSELPELLKAIETCEGDDVTKAAIKLMALTFVRTNELIGAKWEEIDFDRAEWNIPKERMKMRRPHFVPLSKQAIEILKSLHTLTGTKEHLFHSQRGKKAKHISNGAILMALRRMGYQGRMTGHGFRSLASTILNEKKFSPDVIERQLAHQDDDKIRSAYNRAEYRLERMKMMQDWADFLDQVATGGDVIQAKFPSAPQAIQAYQ
jgi:integrase